ncbi:hypothetical protein JRO89_XS04G0047700 [Xanthoceras sorbifolium]|uniref:Vps72/YL1 C-terminal domain-containing protein n=1 Tax=Xanthoceras sorbifolium TaxID=99658 RepID=A0ABQ8I4D1_9ROSI|nr:hypothetical protein JRO89_XS04G0047700 [Xanthoceras sorbifolium]
MEASNKEDAPVFLDRGSRATRGKRMTKLLDDEIEEDELFWNQDALKEEEEDVNYEEEPEVADEFDSDFDEDEPEPDEEGENDADERVQKKRLIFPGRPSTKKKKKQKVLSKLDNDRKDMKSTQESTPPENHDVPDDPEGERIVRKSTRTAVIVRQAERDAIRAALQATMKPIKRKKEGEEKRMTQEEMLLEAAQTGSYDEADYCCFTFEVLGHVLYVPNLSGVICNSSEIINLRNLERVLAREEEVKKRAIVHKAVYSGPQIRYLSKEGCSYLEFSKGVSFQSQISTASIPYPEKAVCAVTGLPAKYRDPRTGLPYATKEAFKILQERFVDQNSGIQKEMDMGVLFESLAGYGFTDRRRRSEISTKSKMSHDRYLARFRTIPALEIEDSD